MTAPTPRLAETPATIRSPGPPLGAHNCEVYGEIGIDDTELQTLSREGIV
jgi:formyl-CoA transferase